MRDVIGVSGVGVLELYEFMLMFRERVDFMVGGDDFYLGMAVECVASDVGVMTDIVMFGSRGGKDYFIAGDIIDMVDELRVCGGGVVSRNIDGIFIFGERRFIEFYLDVPHAC